MHFVKMHGIGNDFVMVDALKGIPAHADALSRAICDRRKGIGSDGLIFILPGELGDFRMRMFNPDGSEAEMCGNGIRCFAKYVLERGLTRKEQLTVETLAGPIGLDVRRDTPGAGRVRAVRVDMGRPRLERADIQMQGAPGRCVGEPIAVGGRTLRVTAVSMGNPHCVVFIDDVASFPVGEFGPLLEKHPAFPRQTNVEFVQVLGRGEVRQRTWERGAGETHACGTGASATGVAGVLNGLTDRAIVNHLVGGDLRIEWPRDEASVIMEGPAEEVFEGEWKGA